MRYDDFWELFKKNFRKIKLKKFTKCDNLNPVAGCCQGNLGITNLASKYDCSNSCSFQDMMFFLDFLKISRKLSCEQNQKIRKSQPCSWVLPEYSHGLRILPTNFTAQILVVFEI